MQCPYCSSTSAYKRNDTTDLGYLQYCCYGLKRQYNERTGTLLNRIQRRGKSGDKWHTDATYIKVKGHWCYLYRAIDKEGNNIEIANTRTTA